MGDTPRVFTSIGNGEVRERIAGILKAAHYETVPVESRSQMLSTLKPERDIIILEENDDVSALYQQVRAMYEEYAKAESLPIIALLSSETVRRNPMLSCWLIDGHSALYAILPPEDEHIAQALLRLIRIS